MTGGSLNTESGRFARLIGGSFRLSTPVLRVAATDDVTADVDEEADEENEYGDAVVAAAVPAATAAITAGAACLAGLEETAVSH